MENKQPNNEIVIYRGDGGQPSIHVRIQGETVWLNQAQLAELFSTSRPNITMHIKNIFGEGELIEDSVCKDFLHTAADRKIYTTKHYNLDLIISLGYRIRSDVATRFRQWATAIDYDPQANASLEFFKIVHQHNCRIRVLQDGRQRII